MLKKDIFIGQKVGFISNEIKRKLYIGTVTSFDEEFPNTHVIIKINENEFVRKSFKNILGLLE